MSILLVKREVQYDLYGWIQDDVLDTDNIVLEKVTETTAAISRRTNGVLKPTAMMTRIYSEIVDGQLAYFTKTN